jgi:hypothetical protein
MAVSQTLIDNTAQRVRAVLLMTRQQRYQAKERMIEIASAAVTTGNLFSNSTDTAV